MKRANDDAALSELGAQLHRVRRRAARLRRKIDSDAGAWQRWSAAIAYALHLVSQISHAPARDVRGVSIKLDAVIWLLVHDGAILDSGAQRRRQALGREVRALAGR